MPRREGEDSDVQGAVTQCPAGGQSEAFLALTSLWSSLGGGEHQLVFFFFFLKINAVFLIRESH